MEKEEDGALPSTEKNLKLEEWRWEKKSKKNIRLIKGVINIIKKTSDKRGINSQMNKNEIRRKNDMNYMNKEAVPMNK